MNDPLQSATDDQLPSRLTGWQRRRSSAAQSDDGSLREGRLYFCDVDRLTNNEIIAVDPSIGEVEKVTRSGVVDKIAAFLKKRIEVRARSYTRGAPVSIPRARGGVSIDEVALISGLLLNAAEQHYGDVRMATNAARIATAYERFACGQLRHIVDTETVCAPNSAYFMMFAEFAWLAIEHELSADVWAAMMSGLVRSQLMYACAYGPRFLAPAGLNSYHQPIEPFAVDNRTRDLIRRSCERATLSELDYETSRNAYLCFGLAQPSM